MLVEAKHPVLIIFWSQLFKTSYSRVFHLVICDWKGYSEIVDTDAMPGTSASGQLSEQCSSHPLQGEAAGLGSA